MGDGGWSELHKAVASWLPSADLWQHSNDALLLRVDVMELACSQEYPRVLAALLTDPGERCSRLQARIRVHLTHDDS